MVTYLSRTYCSILAVHFDLAQQSPVFLMVLRLLKEGSQRRGVRTLRQAQGERTLAEAFH